MLSREKVVGCLRASGLTLATLFGVIGGVVFGLALRTREAVWTDREVMYVAYIGELFLRMLKALILPLIVPSLITAVGSLDMTLSGKVGMRAIVYYMGTTVSAVALGIVLVVTIHPGVAGQDKGDIVQESRNVTTPDTLMDLIRNMVPPNLIQATVQQYRTALIYPGNFAYNDSGQIRNPNDTQTWKMKGEWTAGTNILGLVFFAVIIGIALAKMGEKGKPLLAFFSCLSDAMMTITTWVINLAPIGVFFLIGGQVLGTNDFGTVLNQLGWYFTTVLVGLFIHGFIVLPIILSVCTKSMPFRFIANMTNAFTTAFGTGSSSATLPVTIRLLEEKNHVDPRVCRFVLPIGATINMDGTALYEAVAAIFIAQVNGMDLSMGQILAISITATAASIGAAGIPQAGLVTMVMVLETVGLPPEDVTIILAVDWLLDRFRTAINVLGDSIGAGIVYHLSKDELDDMEKIGGKGEGFETVPLTEVEERNFK
ncbi:excitatory amino acid transporter 3 [Eurytemora carolleeae]|uniref:excitatory amino acid transporter 3 n=1 Tax=Eurytemora carolleeae TaxID=1294199 RepID=UPI000C778C07|nr:excitatory amino acid transporter 3 [Eurytemora carolleeae]XP_023326226.1 excitatory amino acid transporter 3 [Eurytemora carolleeae]|eukprot:XP_023326225.1 excitatory amino acid transporter 3-like [Eurytemora affinis]